MQADFEFPVVSPGAREVHRWMAANPDSYMQIELMGSAYAQGRMATVKTASMSAGKAKCKKALAAAWAELFTLGFIWERLTGVVAWQVPLGRMHNEWELSPRGVSAAKHLTKDGYSWPK